MKNFSKLLIKSNQKIEEAIKKLDKNVIKILIVIDQSSKLVGTITDGDIRRGLLKGIGIKNNSSDVMRKNPIFSFIDENKASNINKMKKHKIFHLPIVDKKMKVIGLEISKPNSEKDIKSPVLIMAGGFGKRLMPLTKDTPKPMLIVGKKPILETILIKLAKEGFSEFYISVHYKSEIIKDYFKDGSSYGVKIKYLQEKNPLGTGGAISLLPSKINKPIIVMNGDILTDLNFRSLIEYHQSCNSFATVCCSKYTINVPYGVINQKNNEMISLIEKPSQDFFINAGIYIFDKEVLALIFKSIKMDITDILTKIINNNKKVSVFPIHEKWIDIGERKEFRLAQFENTK